MLQGRRIALIGGAGFIGHHLALRLKQAGADVCVIDGLMVNNLLSFRSTGTACHNRSLYLQFVQQRLDLLHEHDIPVHAIDARSYHALSGVFRDLQPHVVVHLAAVANASISNKNPYSTFDHSLRTLENALDAARSPRIGVEQFVYFSSSMVYGHFSSAQVTEDSPCDPLGIYGALKFAGEKMVIAYNQVFDLPYTIVRPSALYGRRCVGRRVAQLFIENAIAGQPLRVQGDGEERLDFTHIDDLVDGLLCVLCAPAARNQVFNLTHGQSRSIATLAQLVKGHFPDVQIHHVTRDRLTPFRGTLSIDRARALINYQPRVPLEDGIARYVEWYRELLNEGGGRSAASIAEHLLIQG